MPGRAITYENRKTHAKPTPMSKGKKSLRKCSHLAFLFEQRKRRLKISRRGFLAESGENRMKNCTDCKYAEWQKTATGRLHPSGDGLCAYPYVMPALPASMYWIGKTHPSGGAINRKKDLSDHCAYFSRA